MRSYTIGRRHFAWSVVIESLGWWTKRSSESWLSRSRSVKILAAVAAWHVRRSSIDAIVISAATESLAYAAH